MREGEGRLMMMREREGRLMMRRTASLLLMREGERGLKGVQGFKRVNRSVNISFDYCIVFLSLKD